MQRTIASHLHASMPAVLNSPQLAAARRYNAARGLLTLTCEKHPHREANRRDILDTLHALVAGVRSPKLSNLCFAAGA